MNNSIISQKMDTTPMFNPSKNGMIRNRKTGKMMTTQDFYLWVSISLTIYDGPGKVNGSLKDSKHLIMAVAHITGHSISLSESIAKNMIKQKYLRMDSNGYTARFLSLVKPV